MVEQIRRGVQPAKNIDNLLSKDYYTSPAKVRKLQEAFERDSSDGWFNASIGFKTYFSDYVRIEEEIVGLKTKNGIEITSPSEHLMTRIYGTSNDPITGNYRIGVTVDELKDALINGISSKIKEKANGTSQVFTGRYCEAIINPTTGNIISALPKKR